MRMISQNGLIFRIEDSGEATLTECGQSATVLELPAEIEGHLLTDVEPDAFDHCGPVEAFAVQAGCTSLRVRDGVLFDRTGVRLIRYPSGRTDREYMPPSGTGIIGFGAFSGAQALRSVLVPDGVHTVEGLAFADCAALENVRLPLTLEKLGHEVFRGCLSLARVQIPAAHPFLRVEEGCLVDTEEETLLCCLPGTAGLEVTAPAGIRYVDDYAFYGCRDLEKVYLHHGLRTLGKYAFYHCGALKEVHLPDGVRSIGTRAFSGCVRLKSLYVPDSVTSIEYKAFNHCDQLTLAVNKGSYTERYCRQFGFPYRHRIHWPWDKNA